MPDPTKRPLVRPPRMAQGGGVAAAFGGSGAPGIAAAGDHRAQDLALSYADDARGRFTERIFVFPQFADLAPGGDTNTASVDTQQIQVVSNRTDFVRLVALRGVIMNSDSSPTAYDLSNLKLVLSINGEEDLMTTGNSAQPASFEILFSESAAPWFWFAAPPRLRVGDTVQARIVNTWPVTEGAPTLTPELAVRLVDDLWWRELYG